MEMIGDKTIVYRGNFICPPGNDITITTEVDGWSIGLTISFELNNNLDRGVKIEPNKGHAKLIFTNWDNGLGNATTKPVAFGTHHDGRELFFMACNYLIGQTNKFDFQLLLGGGNE